MVFKELEQNVEVIYFWQMSPFYSLLKHQETFVFREC